MASAGVIFAHSEQQNITSYSLAFFSAESYSFKQLCYIV